MPLPSNAKVSDVINLLNDTQGVNQKLELASVVGSPATANDNIATQIGILQDAKTIITSKIQVPSNTPFSVIASTLQVGSRVASGVKNGNNLSISENGLNFRPSIVLIKRLDSTPNQEAAMYISRQKYTNLEVDARAFVLTTNNTPTASFTITDTGFTFSAQGINNAGMYLWIAVE